MSLIQQLKDQDFNDTISNAKGPVLVDFWAEWCGPCKMMNPVLESLAGELDGSVAIAKLNVDESPDIAQRYSVRGIPTLMLFNNGELVAQRTGAGSQQQVKAFIEQSL
ncbi:Thioredoxin 1 [Zhongshania aliphaticivorans]|uniref:Thioredoxin n=1 Tax=Zhongshania aliphaticivorans TaxID=1470434 RepID=A0A5S9NI83_9GAMM|nr:thioredoxin [Zhongshania aliphaticivorans]CAA0090292.1 Thioredoxin 1 [Zhongshania aliphaticivorans]CAA0097706.1 Thioredoxin 1 [Zhongshania aliphaticivorans]